MPFGNCPNVKRCLMETPKTNAGHELREKKLPWWKFGCAGGAIGGCLVPFILMLILGMGGPLFWPIMSIPLALAGVFFGTIVWIVRRETK